MKRLTWWFRSTGVIYVVLGVSWLPFANAPKLEQVIPGFDGPANGTAYNGFLDWMVVFGLEMIVVGVFLFVSSWRPLANEPLVWLVVALSAVRGIADDIYMIVQGYPVASNLVFIGLHSAIIVTGVLALRAARRSEAVSRP
jgi:uncharacterized membrane protein HdeD (DUF308 family)